MKPIPKEDIQSLERDILFQVLDFFEQYHITYFTSGGTTLGAVRHEGFIPWDDDIDLYIPRADYNRMLNWQPIAPSVKTSVSTSRETKTIFIHLPRRAISIRA